jgi:hypothetical protein
MRRLHYFPPLIAALTLAVAGGASAFVVSQASSRMVQPQPAPRICNVSAVTTRSTCRTCAARRAR